MSRGPESLFQVLDDASCPATPTPFIVNKGVCTEKALNPGPVHVFRRWATPLAS